MELSRIEQITISFIIVLSLLAVSALIGLQHDSESVFYAAEILVGTVVFAALYSVWYASKPRHRPYSKPNDRRIAAAKALSAARKRNAVWRIGLLCVGIVFFAVALWELARTSRHLSGCFLAGTAVTLGVCCWLHFGAQAPAAGEKKTEKNEEAKKEESLDLLKLEYTKGAERYENIYKAIWQNFSYMTVVSAGILTFGQKSLSMPVLIFLAVTPVLFWYVATFLPMDTYGQDVRTTLGKVEKALNLVVGTDLLSHYSGFANTRFHWRVRDPVRGSGTILSYLWLTSFVFATVHVARAQLATDDERDFRWAVSTELRRLERERPAADTALVGALRSISELLQRRAMDTAAIKLPIPIPAPPRGAPAPIKVAPDTAKAP